METGNIRNFCIISHIDHGKSTLADRMLEITETVEKRKMKNQVLDAMELERERGITIKMTPVRMAYSFSSKPYILNLIDTPGHIDFSYEVSRALKAVEGAVLLVDATQGVQAQTMAVLEMARKLKLKIIPAVNKIDSPLARIPETKKEVASVLDCDESEILEISGKTGQGVDKLLQAVIEKIPAPEASGYNQFRSLVFDFEYSSHKGVIIYIRVVSGKVKKGDNLIFKIANKKFSALEVGVFAPEEKPKDFLSEGEIGYVVTGIKEPGIASVGDTVSSVNDSKSPLEGYLNPQPIVWSSFYPESQDDFLNLKQAMARLKLSDSSLNFEEEHSGILGRGFKAGFLGMLHLEIVMERLKREFGLNIIVTAPTINYVVIYKDGKEEKIYSLANFPQDHLIGEIREPWAKVSIITPQKFLNSIMPLIYEHEGDIKHSDNFGGDRITLEAEMPLRELMRNFFEKLKTMSSGFASVSYEISEMRNAPVAKLEVLLADEEVPAFTRIVSKKNVQREAEKTVEKLFEILPRQMFVVKIQARALGRILSSRTLSALKKDVTAHLYGGDITRKMKLREKQKKGKKKMKGFGKVNIPQDVFTKMVRNED